MKTRSQRSAAVTIARVPFVVDIARVVPRGSRYSRGELPRSKPSIRTPSRSPPSVTPSPASAPRVLDLGRAPDPLVARSERLADRRGRPDHVDHDPRRGRRSLVGSERDVDSHAGTLALGGRGPPLLPASGPGDARLLLRVRPPDLRGVHELRAGRDPVPRPREGRRGRATRAPQRTVRPGAADDRRARCAGDGRARRRQRRSSTWSPSHQGGGHRPARREALPRRRAHRRRDRPRRPVVPARDGDVPPREPAPPRLQHARALLARHDRRAGARDAGASSRSTSSPGSPARRARCC